MKVGHTLYTGISNTHISIGRKIQYWVKRPLLSLGLWENDHRTKLTFIYLISNHLLNIYNGPNYTQVKANYKNKKVYVYFQEAWSLMRDPDISTPKFNGNWERDREREKCKVLTGAQRVRIDNSVWWNSGRCYR